ncbi:MAG: ABC transporter permease [Propionibacteriaceae bacterium]|jgi:multidrug/hemolysin transport system permease protein|nr:ABC transporter permease [Propionibacteriaceae bacterium]
MRNALLLARRNVLVYWRDRTGVFLSFVAALILLVLYAFFLHKLNADGIVEALIPLGATIEDADYFVNAWVYSGIVTVTTVTTGLAALVGFVDDRATSRFTEFAVMPIRRWEIIAGYFLASVTVALAMTTIVMLVGWGILAGVSGQAPGLLNILAAWGWTLLNAAAFSAFSSFLITFIRSTGAFTTLSTIIGTLVGFLTGSYIPTSMLPARVAEVLNVLPFTHAASLIRGQLAEPAMAQLTRGDAIQYAVVANNYGLTLQVGGRLLPAWTPPAGLAAMIVVFGAAATWLLQQRIKRGR